MSKTINVDGLQRTSEVYAPVLRVLPFNELKPRIGAMGIRFLSSDKELREASYERQGAISRPYTKGIEDPDMIDKLGKLKEAKLIPEWGYTALVEDIMNYENVNVIGNSPEHVNPKTKKHPMELIIISSAVKTIGEDILDALYFAERDEDDPTPYGLFNGYNTLIDALETAGELSEVKKNIHATGTIQKPQSADDTSAFDKLVDFLRAANPFLKKGGAILKMTETVYYAAQDALKIQLQYKGSMSYDMLLTALKGESNFPKLTISVEDEMGTGDRIILTKRNNFDFSLWTDPSRKFMQVRPIFKNPNLVQYWSQWKAGSRIRIHHPKEFMMNDGTAIKNQLSGDYLS